MGSSKRGKFGKLAKMTNFWLFFKIAIFYKNAIRFKKMKRLRVGIAGYGIVGSKRHSCLKMHRNVDVIAVCDRNKDQKKN